METDIPPETPLRELLKRVAGAPFLVVKEKANELEEIRKSHGINITVDCDSGAFIFKCDTETGEIFLGLAALERLWCYCYAFQTLHSWRAEHPDVSGFDCETHPNLIPIFAVLQLAKDSEDTKTRVVWSDELARPDIESDKFDIKNGSGHFLYVISFMLLHEVGHIVKAHPPMSVGILPAESIQQEREADAWAIEFSVGDWRERKIDTDEFINRATGIASGLSLLTTVELGLHPDAERDHPKIPDRLLQFFSDHIPDTEELTADLTEFPKYFSSTIIYALLQQRDIQIDYKQVHENFFDLFHNVRALF